MWAKAWQDASKTTAHARNKQDDSTLEAKYIWKVLFWIIAFSGLKFPIIQEPLPAFPPWENCRGGEEGWVKGWWVQLVLSLVGLTSQKLVTLPSFPLRHGRLV